jgi:hypothetical protein
MRWIPTALAALLQHRPHDGPHPGGGAGLPLATPGLVPEGRNGAEHEAARVLARYRRLILLGRLHLTLGAGRRLVGPDCAYHLYGRSSRRLPRR